MKNYGNIKDSYKDALYASLNGKLQWLQYMFSKNHLKNNNYIVDTISMVKSLVKYYNNIDKFYKIYLEVMEEK